MHFILFMRFCAKNESDNDTKSSMHSARVLHKCKKNRSVLQENRCTANHTFNNELWSLQVLFSIPIHLAQFYQTNHNFVDFGVGLMNLDRSQQVFFAHAFKTMATNFCPPPLKFTFGNPCGERGKHNKTVGGFHHPLLLKLIARNPCGERRTGERQAEQIIAHA